MYSARSIISGGQRMFTRRLLVLGLVGLAAGRVAQGQAGQIKAGQTEVGAFGQITIPDFAWKLNTGFGVGARLGYFLTRRFELELDASTSTFSNQAPRP